MELKKGSQPRGEVSLNVQGTVPQLFTTGSRSNINAESSDPEEIEDSRISTAASTLTSGSTSKDLDLKVFSVDDDAFVGPLEKEKDYDVSNEALYKLEEYFQSTSSSSTSQISDVTHESSIPNKHPSIQVMDRTGSFDSDRIPTSIFAKPATIIDWSIVSNESLFSIHIGKGSLSSDHAFILELDHSEEFSIHEGSYSFEDLNELEESIKSEKVKECGDDELGKCKKTISKENEEKAQHFGLGTRISEEPIVKRHYRNISVDAKMKIEGFGNGKANQALPKQQKSPNCGCDSCPSCTWPDWSCKKLCCQGCILSFFSSCCCKPSTWECTWSINKIFCCLSSKSSTKFLSRPRRASDTDANIKWCTCFSCC